MNGMTAGNFTHITGVILAELRPQQLLFLADSDDRAGAEEGHGDQQLREWPKATPKLSMYRNNAT